MFKIGNLVRFDPKVFFDPYKPHYDDYRGHTFEVVKVYFHFDGNDLEESLVYTNHCHVELKCISTPWITVKGLIHDDELYLVEKEIDADESWPIGG